MLIAAQGPRRLSRMALFSSSQRCSLSTCASLRAQRKKLDGSSSTSLKTLLNRFYLLVHPDLFHGNSRAQSVNGKNLSVLNSFVEQLRKDDPPHDPHKVVRFPLRFYVRNKANPGSKEQSDDSSCIRAMLHIDPSWHTRTANPRVKRMLSERKWESVRTQLERLFSSCGLENVQFRFDGFFGNQDDPTSIGDAEVRDVRRSAQSTHVHEFVEFVERHHHIAVERRELRKKLERDVTLARHLIMTLHRGMRMSFGRDIGLERQARLMDELLSPLGGLKERGIELQNVSICFSNATTPSSDGGDISRPYVDVFGRVFLSPATGAEDWGHRLHNIDYAEIMRRQQSLKDTRNLERSVAEKLRVRRVCCDYSTTMASDYQARLNMLLQEMNDDEITMHDDMQNISLVIKDCVEEMSFHPQHSTLTVPLGVKVSHVKSWRTFHGTKCNDDYASLHNLKARQTELRVLVKRALRLTGLTQSPKISDEDMIEALFNLRKHAGHLGILQGFEVVCSDECGISEGGAVACPYDLVSI